MEEYTDFVAQLRKIGTTNPAVDDNEETANEENADGESSDEESSDEETD